MQKVPCCHNDPHSLLKRHNTAQCIEISMCMHNKYNGIYNKCKTNNVHKKYNSYFEPLEKREGFTPSRTNIRTIIQQ